MVEILRPTEGDRSPLVAAAHPVTRVYCDGAGIVCYERTGAEPLKLNQISPKRSRGEALRRCSSLLDAAGDEHSLERSLPISATGWGLTYNQLKQQTYEACLQSRQIEARLNGEFNAKRRTRRS